MLFLLKIAVPPILVALMSLAARRWGPTVGGLLMGLPWMTGPVLFFLGLDKGGEFAVAAMRRHPARRDLHLRLHAGLRGDEPGGALAVLPRGRDDCLLGGRLARAGPSRSRWCRPRPRRSPRSSPPIYLLPRPRTSAVPAPLPWWDIPARMAMTFVLVAVIMSSADRLGPQLSGMVSTYPVILIVVGSLHAPSVGRRCGVARAARPDRIAGQLHRLLPGGRPDPAGASAWCRRSGWRRRPR